MCGISGIISKNKKQIPSNLIKEMTDKIAHRGPDGDGFYVNNRVQFGHRRLAIIDLSNDGHQPMYYNDELIITYNGEIYNYIELRNELIHNGYKFHSKCDTEVILAAYAHWGDQCVNRFNGMWSFAIHDKKNNKVFCSRDRFGVKPFYFSEDDDFFYFGSEIKQLIGKNPKINQEILSHFLFSGVLENNEHTFFDGVTKLQGSHSLILDLNNFNKKIVRYYNLKDHQINTSIEATLDSAIKLRLRSDVKVGTCLSGGIDSTTIASKAAKIYNISSSQKFQAVHARSIEPFYDESKLAQLAANQSNIDLSILAPTSEDFKKYLEEVVYTQEEPFGGPSIFLQYFVMKKAKEIGCKVMLDGQGGDETFLGYERYFIPSFLEFFLRSGISQALKEINLARKNNVNISLKMILKHLLAMFMWRTRLIYAKIKNKHLKKAYMPKNYDYFRDVAFSTLNIKKLQKLEIFKTNLPSLLRYEDKNSMRHSIETRLPFLDYRMVEQTIKMPLEEKISGGWTKISLRKINSQELGNEIAWNKRKLGFNAPEKTWIEQNKEELIKYIQDSEILERYCHKEQIIKDFSNINLRVLWRYVNVGIWEKVYKPSF